MQQMIAKRDKTIFCFAKQVGRLVPSFQRSKSANKSRPAIGHLDPRTQQILFTPETKVKWTA